MKLNIDPWNLGEQIITNKFVITEDEGLGISVRAIDQYWLDNFYIEKEDIQKFLKYYKFKDLYYNYTEAELNHQIERYFKLQVFT